MQTLFDAANHIALEIERTRQHLINLEQALEGLKPLITVDAATTTVLYTLASQAQPVEDLSVINAAVPAKKNSKSKLAVGSKTGKTKAVKTKATKAKADTPEAAAAPVKLPATGAELWLKCIGRKKVTIAQLADIALKKLKLDDSAKEVIATRVKAWAYIATKKGALVVVGDRNGSKLYQLAAASDESPVDNVPAVEEVPTGEVAPIAEVTSAT